ncbi:unnamed protein product [Nesidiocoris tenuis]|uniref:Uncharacterized protein n=1 Tax=Nesidiocoris tenuis TaxID=355587 RepID=A0A6H5HHL3_9HEMI|nr:unnamed protein product [Nesidiocoris tenuis]
MIYARRSGKVRGSCGLSALHGNVNETEWIKYNFFEEDEQLEVVAAVFIVRVKSRKREKFSFLILDQVMIARILLSREPRSRRRVSSAPDMIHEPKSSKIREFRTVVRRFTLDFQLTMGSPWTLSHSMSRVSKQKKYSRRSGAGEGSFSDSSGSVVVRQVSHYH